MQKKPKISGLYAITPETPGIKGTAQLLVNTRAALAGGARIVQYRSKSTDIAFQHEQATELLALCREFRVPLIINDDVRLAALTDADGVHLGQDDARLVEARINLGPDKIIGVSCYQDLARALRFEAEGADYVAFGSFFTSPTKPEAPLCPLSLLHAAKAQLHLPIVAIGGITLDNAQSLVDAGADALAVISALFDAPNIEACAQAFSDLFATRH